MRIYNYFNDNFSKWKEAEYTIQFLPDVLNNRTDCYLATTNADYLYGDDADSLTTDNIRKCAKGTFAQMKSIRDEILSGEICIFDDETYDNYYDWIKSHIKVVNVNDIMDKYWK